MYIQILKIFDELTDSKEILDCADDISRYYDDLIELTSYYNLLGLGKHKVNGKTVKC